MIDFDGITYEIFSLDNNYNLKHSFPDILKWCQYKMGRSGVKMAELLGVPYQNYNKWITGKIDPPRYVQIFIIVILKKVWDNEELRNELKKYTKSDQYSDKTRELIKIQEQMILAESDDYY